MKKTIIFIITCALLGLIIISLLGTVYPKSESPDFRSKYLKKRVPSVDHKKFKILQKNFKSPQEVTKACLSCHTERHKEVMASSHWKWEREVYIEGRGVKYIGKKNLLNNFCIGMSSNEQACNKCHAGFGWKDKSFDFNKAHNIDCMVCHDNTGEYFKGNSMAGYPKKDTDFNKVAQGVGIPKKNNCGSCHFTSGGGNNVKHGDLETALLDCTKDVDVHMASEGADMKCVDCHSAENHVMKGKLYTVSSMNKNRATCTDCHDNQPHKNNIINEHTGKIACQTCHIPTYAKANHTKMSWDWSTAGKLKDGKPITEKDKHGNNTYLSKKGTFTWGKNVKPEYVWFNGTADHYILGDKIDPNKTTKINTLFGSYADNKSQIIPVKVHRGKQPYDKVHNTLIQPNVFAKEKGKGAFWKDFDWDKASKNGMDYVGLPYSGKYGFAKTEMYWPLNHMVSKSEEALSCADCHNRDNSRLAGLNDFYMPGRDYNTSFDGLGRLLIILSILGVLVHATVRYISYYRRSKYGM